LKNSTHSRVTESPANISILIIYEKSMFFICGSNENKNKMKKKKKANFEIARASKE